MFDGEEEAITIDDAINLMKHRFGGLILLSRILFHLYLSGVKCELI